MLTGERVTAQPEVEVVVVVEGRVVFEVEVEVEVEGGCQSEGRSGATGV